MRLIFIGIILLFIGCQSSNTLFESLDSDHTGITFSNNIEVSDTFNILESQYLYNGGGVGVGDFNNDGLEDVFFTGNHVDNQLYLNQGDFKFKDISAVAGIGSTGFWSSGVSVVDINVDGLMDIYVNNTTHPEARDRQNHLYINQGFNTDGIPVFQESAEAYGLADDSYTVNSAFFDYDNDGDLDVVIIINEQGDVRGTIAFKKRDKNVVYQRVDKLYRNDWDEQKGHPVFTDVSEEAGISVSGFSLGVNITDINKDGWKDIYITNDFITDDVLYINQQDGTFKNEAKQFLKHTSYSAMGNDVADFNNDGYSDIVALDMLPEDNYRQKRMMGPTSYTSYLNNKRFGINHQYVRNTLQLNPGIDANHAYMFSDVSMMSGIAATDWSWTPLVADFDHDGFRDLIVTNGFPKDVTDRDYMDYRADAARFSSREVMLSKIPSAELPNYAYRNNGDMTFEDATSSWGLADPTFSNGAVYADLDNDGDLDIVINNIDREASILRNTINDQAAKSNWIGLELKGAPSNPNAVGATIKIITDQDVLSYEHSIYRGYLSSNEQRVHFGIGDRIIEKIEINWSNSKSCTISEPVLNQYQEISYASCASDELVESKDNSRSLLRENQSLQHVHLESDYIDFNIQPLLPYKLSQFGPAMSVGDVNGDQLDDVYVSGPAFTNGYFMKQTASGQFNVDTLRSVNPDIEEMGTLLFDADGDQDLDMYIVSGSYEFSDGDSILQDQFLINENGGFRNATDRLPFFLSSGSCARAADYDRDGDLDIFVGGRLVSGEYPSPADSYLLNNQMSSSKNRFELDQSDLFRQLGMVTDALWTDYNNDGWIDLIVTRDFAPILIFENNEGQLSKKEINKETKGFWNSIAAGDVDNDGDMDYLVGNRGYNTFNKINKDYPFQIFVNDFDQNDNSDAVPMAYFKDRDGGRDLYPTASRMDFTKEINVIRRKYPTYEIYAQVNKDILFKDSTLAETDIYEVNYTATSILLNNGADGLEIKPLNKEAQVAPVFGSILTDIDGDDVLDILLVGNDFGSELIHGRMDAFNGLFLKGNGDGTFASLPSSESGFYVPGDGKSLVSIKSADRLDIIAGENMGAIRYFERSSKNEIVSFRNLEYRAIIEYDNGRMIKEMTYGSGFLSQSSRSFIVPKDATRITFISFDGKEREVNINE